VTQQLVERSARAGAQPKGPVSSHVPAEFLVVRSPLLPVEWLERLGGDLHAPAAVGNIEALEAALREDRAKIRSRLRDLVARPALAEALYLASPSFHAALQDWGSADPAESERIERALMRYVCRAAYRSTPFGLFAGCSVAPMRYNGGWTSLEFGPLNEYRRTTRLDLGFLAALLQTCLHDHGITGLRYVINSSLYLAGGRQHFVESRVTETGVVKHQLSAVDSDSYLRSVLEAARSGATWGELLRALVDDTVTEDEAREYLGELIDAQVLVAEIGVMMTGSQPLDAAIEDLAAIPQARPVAIALDGVRQTLAVLDVGGVGAPASSYVAVEDRLRSLVPGYRPKDLFQVELFKPIRHAGIDRQVVADLQEAMSVLRRIIPQHDELRDFVTTFVERYGDREVPLPIVLDEEVGIGLPAYDGRLKDAPARIGANQTRQGALVEIVSAVLAAGGDELVLTERELRRLEVDDAPPLPDSVAVMASISQPGDAQGEGRTLWLGAYGPAGANLLGRFCHGDDALRHRVAEYLRAEEALRPDAVFAEVVHLSQGRIGNVVCRPVLREFEIPYLGRSGVPEEMRIPVEDLLVSVVGGMVRLRSARLNREVIPRLASMHNFRHAVNLPVYRFLGLLQSHCLATQLSWDWGLLRGLSFLPRVRYGRVILARATWSVKQDELQSILGPGRGVERYRRVQQWRTERKLPRFVVMLSGDNHLPIDLDSVVAVDTMLDLARRQGQISLGEMFPAPGDNVARGPEGRFMTEIVVPFSAREPQRRVVRLPARESVASEVRTCPPGARWTFLKIYTGKNLIDWVLHNGIADVVRQQRAAGAIESWFFIRYADPHVHIRLRARPTSRASYHAFREAMENAMQPLLHSGVVYRIQYDTYEREIERYGGTACMDLSEQAFCDDSDAVLVLLRDHVSSGRIDRETLAIRCVDNILDAFGFSIGERIALLSQRIDGTAASTRKAWGASYRQKRKAIEECLGESDDEVGTVLGASRESLRAVSRYLVVPGMRSEIVFSFTHMHLNRLLSTIDNKAIEPMIYDFLRRYYMQSRARSEQALAQAVQA
jgi:thiopeptide-type bacteriocin biosynthesis protein